MGFLQTLKHWFRTDESDPEARVLAKADAERRAYERDSIRVSQGVQARGGGGSMTPTPENLRAQRDDR